MHAWQTILIAFGGNAALLAVLGLLGKSLLEKLITRDTKRFEADLKAKSDAVIEQLRSDLHIRSIEHQVRFSRLHEKRAAVIADLYSHLVETLSEAESFLSLMECLGDRNKREKHRDAEKKLVDFFRYFDKHRIYLPEDICVSLESLAEEVRLHVIKFGVYVEFDERDLRGGTRAQKEKTWTDGWEAIKNQVPQARKLLEEEFRVLLGAAANAPPNLTRGTNAPIAD